MIDKEEVLKILRDIGASCNKKFEENYDSKFGYQSSIVGEIYGLISNIKEKQTCKWTEQEDLNDEYYYITSCDQYFSFCEGSQKYEDFKYCPYCSKEIEWGKE
jgi:hypothetical protein